MKFLTLTLIFILTSCASYKDTVHTMDDSSKPSWVQLEKPTWEDDGKIYAVSIAEVDHDSHYSSAKRVSDNTARTELAKIIKNKLVSTVEVNEPDFKTKKYTLLSSEQVDLVVRKMVVEKNWFEIVEVDNLDETKRKEMHVYSLVSIKKEDLKKVAEEDASREVANK